MNKNIATVENVKTLNVRKLVIMGVLSAISIMLSITPLGYIPIGPVQATIMHLPVIIGAILEGPLVGAVIGLVFGVTSLLRAVLNPSVASFLFMNPVISVVPRVLMGFLAYYIYMGLFKVSRKTAAPITGFLASMINTVGVLGSIYVLYAERYLEVIGKSGSAAKIIGAIAVTNGVPEAILAAVVVSAVVGVMKRIRKH